MDVDALAGLVNKLNKIREERGEEAWRQAMTQFGKDCIKAGGQSEIFARTIFKGMEDQGLDWAAMVKEAQDEMAAAQTPSEQVFLKALAAQFPAMKSQGQFTAFQASLEAYRAVINGVLAQDKEAEAKGRGAFDKAIETLRMATDLTLKLADVPEAATSAAAEDFKKPPTAFTEYDVQRSLLSELQQLGTLQALDAWWTANRKRVDEVKSPTLRNPLIDLVREKKTQLSRGPQVCD